MLSVHLWVHCFLFSCVEFLTNISLPLLLQRCSLLMLSNVSLIAIGIKVKNGSFSECSAFDPVWCCCWWVYLLWISVYTWFLLRYHYIHHQLHQSCVARSVAVAWNDYCAIRGPYVLWLARGLLCSVFSNHHLTIAVQSNPPSLMRSQRPVRSLCRFTFGWMNHDELMRIRA